MHGQLMSNARAIHGQLVGMPWAMHENCVANERPSIEHRKQNKPNGRRPTAPTASKPGHRN
eukprot:4797908-Lingulodinium_polyedra.AAC.1